MWIVLCVLYYFVTPRGKDIVLSDESNAFQILSYKKPLYIFNKILFS